MRWWEVLNRWLGWGWERKFEFFLKFCLEFKREGVLVRILLYWFFYEGEMLF